jgi:uncharacterized protein YeaO (DUF488 family)
MPIATKRWNDPTEPEDGFRALVCRYRPRGVSKDDESWDAWMPDLGPSRELHAAYWDEERPLPWSEYSQRYLTEMMQPTGRGAALLASLATRVAAGETITLLCSSACTDPAHCHRTLLASLINRAADRLAKRHR